MKEVNIIKSLNLTEGEILTLEKAKDRIEFEALGALAAKDCFIVFGDDCPCNGGTYTECECNSGYNPCSWKNDQCGVKDVNIPPCLFDLITPCDCKGPVGYIDCRPYHT